MTTRKARWAIVALSMAISTIAATAQTPPPAPPAGDDSPARGARAARNQAPANAGQSDTLSTEQVYTLLDAVVMARAQAALQLNDGQWAPFVQRLLKLQSLQRQHRNQRQRLLREIRQLIGPNAPQTADDATITAKTKELDDLEARVAQDEAKALADIDQVLNVRQRAYFRVFLENMERQKLDLLLRARQRANTPAPAPTPTPPPAQTGRFN
jgi:hypothetical protein